VVCLTCVLLCIWFGVSFVGPWFASDLDQLRLGDFPFGFWMASQGALIIFVLLIAVYAWWMDRIESRQPGPGAPSSDRPHG
jgi:putative solute:sodium symporter small subunit